MKSISVNTAKPYNYLLGRGLIESLPLLLSQNSLNPGKILIVTDRKILDTVQSRLSGVNAEFFLLPRGEDAKSFDVYRSLCAYLLERRFASGDLLVALGGGSVCDLCGFAAATYRRGIDYVNIPTTLLCAADASLGGKTAVNLNSVKNAVGAFWQPSLVVCDLGLLPSVGGKVDLIPARGELLKYAVLIGNEAIKLLLADFPDAESLLSLCVGYKAKIVSADEYDKGTRRLLNLGHTIAHSVESLSGNKISHSDAVAAGTFYMCRLSNGYGVMPDDSFRTVAEIFSRLDAPTALPFPADQLLHYVDFDKKITAGRITLATVKDIGFCRLVDYSLSDAKHYLSGTLR